MMKRALAWLLCLTMLISFVPATTLGAAAASPAMPGASEWCDHTDHTGWTAWTNPNALPDGNTAGKYYLETDVKLTVAWDCYAQIHLCLNGHSITQTGSAQRVMNVREPAVLSVYDCDGNGIITGGTGTSGAAANVNRAAVLNLYGGTITGNGNSASGGAIYLSAANDTVKIGGMFNMYGGTITGNSCANGNVYVAGGKSGYTNTVFNMYGGVITGNSASGNGAAILAKAYGVVNITDGIITGNTAATGSAVSVTDNAKITVCGNTVIANNTNAAKTADVVVADKLYVNELTGGSNITVQTTADQTDANKVLAVNGQQTASWQAGWVTYKKLAGTETDIGYITSGSGKAFAFGHYHGDQKYTAYDGGANHNLMKTAAGYYYLTYDISRSPTSASNLSLDKNATQHLCLNGHKFIHNNPAIRLYYLDAGDNLFIEDCTSYYNEKNEFVAGGIYFGGASDSTVADGSFMQVNKGGTATLENIKITGFHSTKSPVFRVLGEAANRGTLNLTNVEISDNSNAGTAAVIYANTGATVNMTDCVVKNNTANAASVINTGGDAKVTVTDCIITDNVAQSYGTFNVANGNTVFKLVGATQVYGNQGGNLHLQKGEAYVYNLDGLTAGAKVGITLYKDRIAEKQMHFTGVVAEGKNPMPYCVSDDDTYKVAKDDKGRLALVVDEGPVTPPTPPATHTHKLCADSACTSHGGDVTFEPWDDATKLPETAGNYYLTTDVKVANRAGLTSVNVNLCLNGHTITPADTYANSRAFYLRGTSKLTLTDCAANPGKISGFTNTALMFDSGCTDAAISIHNIEISGNTSTKTGSAIIVQGTGVFNLYSGKIVDNETTGSATIYASGTTTVNLLGGEISGNTAGAYAGGLYLEGGKTKVNLTGTKITGNTAGTNAGGIYLKTQVAALNISGDAQVTNNTVNGAANNLYLAGTTVFTPGKLNSGKQVGITTETADRAITTTLAADVSAGYTSDDAEKVVTYENNALHLGELVKHNHCVCAGTGCSHSEIKFQPWTSTTSLPEVSGNYFLTGDVTVSNRAGLKDVTVNLCLNGFTIKAADSYTTKSRAFYLYDASKLTITDCAANPGKITNFKNSAIMSDGTCTDARIDIYNIEISGNSNTGSGAAIILQGTSELNFHSGKITGNTAEAGAGAIYAAGTAKVNLIGGEISGNTAKTNGGALVGDSAKTVFYLSGTKISGNTGGNGGAILLQNRSHLEMTGGEISGNHTTVNGTVYISNNSSMAMSGGKITGNISDDYTAAISVQTGAKLTLSGDAQITNNEAKGTYGGIYVHNQNGGVSISGNVQISGNICKDKPSNLYLAGTSTFTAGKLGENGNVGISTGQFFRAISKEVTEDVSAGYYSDNKSLAVIYQDNALFLGAPDGHSHCFCAAGNNRCDHAQVKFAPWESATSLPESGNWYLTQDVTVTNRSGPTNAGLNLCLNGHTIRVAENYTKGRAFYMYNAAKLTITDCNEKPGVITGGNEGAVVFDGTCDGAEFNMYNITMSGNSNTTGGGAVLVQGTATFNMYSGTMTDNTAYTVLALDADGNPKLDADGNQTYKSNLGGGAVASSGVKSEINIYGGKLVNNRANRLEYLKANGSKATVGGNGGAIYAKGNLNIYEGVEISGNFAEGNGGGILAGGNNTTITIHGGKITGNTGKAGGGLISQNLTHVIINGGEISGNSGTTAGGVYVSIRSKLTMNGGTIANNTSSGEAGGMHVYASTVTLNAGSIKNNTAKGNGGGISSSKGTAIINNVNTDLGAIITINKDFSITGNYTEKNAGGVMLNGKGGELTLNGGSISNNKAKAAAGGVLTQNSSTFYFKSGKISNNNANTGGGIFASTNTTLKMTGGSITGNTTVKSTGAGIQMLRSTGYLSGGTISGNNSGSQGGGVYLSGATAYLQGTYIANNVAKTNGGGVGTGQATATVNGVTQKFQCKLVLSGSTIANNKANNGGGVILQSYTVMDMTGGVIRDNEATAAAGGIYASTNATVNMTGGAVIGNHSVKNGGGLYHMNSKGNYTGGKIEGNTCDGNGAAFLGSGANTVINVKGYDFTGCNGTNGSVATIQSKAVFNVEDCKFYDNWARTTGTVYISTYSFASFTNCKFYNNKAPKQAGAIFGAQDSKVTISDCIFTENTAGTDGGAILCRGSFYLTNCQVENNTAGGNGGGIATGKCGIRGSKFQDGLVMTNVTVKDNTSGAQGGGLYLSTGCKTTMTDVQITGNASAMEGGAFWAVDDTTLHNVTATGNISGGEGFAAWYDYSIFDGHSYFVGVHKISGDIIIKDNQGGDIYLGQEVAMSVGYEGLGEKTYFGVTLDSGVLTNRLYGEYNYEGGNQEYIVTYGSRSFEEPEYDQGLKPAEQEKAKNVDVLLYAGIGIVALAAVAAVVLVVAKKKKAGKPAAESKN